MDASGSIRLFSYGHSPTFLLQTPGHSPLDPVPLPDTFPPELNAKIDEWNKS
jgi:hypothetical protein